MTSVFWGLVATPSEDFHVSHLAKLDRFPFIKVTFVGESVVLHLAEPEIVCDHYTDTRVIDIMRHRPRTEYIKQLSDALDVLNDDVLWDEVDIGPIVVSENDDWVAAWGVPVFNGKLHSSAPASYKTDLIEIHPLGMSDYVVSHRYSEQRVQPLEPMRWSWTKPSKQIRKYVGADAAVFFDESPSMEYIGECRPLLMYCPVSINNENECNDIDVDNDDSKNTASDSVLSQDMSTWGLVDYPLDDNEIQTSIRPLFSSRM